MTTAVDSSVLLEYLRFRCQVRPPLEAGGTPMVWAEVASFFPSPAAVKDAMKTLGAEYDSISQRAPLAAAGAWKAYRVRGGKRERVVADFLIGAHAFAQADRLLTRDRGFYRAYFTRLRVLDPSDA